MYISLIFCRFYGAPTQHRTYSTECIFQRRIMWKITVVWNTRGYESETLTCWYDCELLVRRLLSFFTTCEWRCYPVASGNRLDEQGITIVLLQLWQPKPYKRVFDSNVTLSDFRRVQFLCNKNIVTTCKHFYDKHRQNKRYLPSTCTYTIQYLYMYHVSCYVNINSHTIYIPVHLSGCLLSIHETTFVWLSHTSCFSFSYWQLVLMVHISPYLALSFDGHGFSGFGLIRLIRKS